MFILILVRLEGMEIRLLNQTIEHMHLVSRVLKLVLVSTSSLIHRRFLTRLHVHAKYLGPNLTAAHCLQPATLTILCSAIKTVPALASALVANSLRSSSTG